MMWTKKSHLVIGYDSCQSRDLRDGGILIQGRSNAYDIYMETLNVTIAAGSEECPN